MSKLKNDEVEQVVSAELKEQTARADRNFTNRKYQALQKRHARLQREYDTLTGHLNQKVAPVNITARAKGKRGTAVPIIVLSDWHTEEEVKPSTVGGKNKYNLDVATARAEHIFQSAYKLIKEKESEMVIRDVAVFLLGDFITGRIHEENVENALLAPVDALLFVQSIIEGGINFWLNAMPDKRFNFYCKVGNHSRITQRVHASTEAGNSLELAMYSSLKRMYQQCRWHIEPSYLSTVDILGYTVRYHHGHAVNYRGGVGGLHIPLRKAIHNWNQSGQVTIDVLGHFHNFTEFTTHKYIVNGSLIGYSAYAERIKAIAEPPIQGFALLHKKYGFTSLTPIFGE